MRLRLPIPGAALSARRRTLRGFTLAELMVTMTIVLLVMGALLTAHFFGLRLFELTKAKLGASDEARAAISTLIQEIRSAKLLRIGDGSLATFSEVAVDSPQKGSAIQVYPSSNTNSFVRYFWDAADRKLKRTTNGATYVSVVANSISNQLIFTSEDYTGTILTNNENNRVIGLTLQFYQLQYPAVAIGPGNYFDYYQLSTKITRRTLE
jgi:prepilin-type N-terminal cleavage/methylation domain-containing protein